MIVHYLGDFFHSGRQTIGEAHVWPNGGKVCNTEDSWEHIGDKHLHKHTYIDVASWIAINQSIDLTMYLSLSISVYLSIYLSLLSKL